MYLVLSLRDVPVLAGEICGILNNLNRFATCRETSLYDPPTTPVIALVVNFNLGADPSLHSKAVASTLLMDALMNSSDWLRA